MRILVTGSSGLIGTALCESLIANGHDVVRLVRGQPDRARNAYQWDPQAGNVDPDAFAGCDGVVHLAGENIGSCRWTAVQKARIRESRVLGTRTMCKGVLAAEAMPKVFVCASAIGFYGDRGDEVLDEDAAAGAGFLPEVCQAWEAEGQPLADKGVRVAYMRTGIVLSRKGGALAKMLTPFRLGAGGVIGSGRQYMSWIDLDDLVAAFAFALEDDSVQGPVNVVAPNPVTNRTFTKSLGRVLRRPTLFPIPAAAARLAFGEMADALLLASTRVVPASLKDAGFHFKYPELEASLRHVLGR